MIIHNPILTGSFTVNGTDVSSITSSAANLTALNAITASILSTTGSLNTASGSAITRLSSIEIVTGSNITRLNSIEIVTGSNITRLSSLEAKTGSYATTGSNTFIGTQTISGSILQSGSFTSTGTLTAQTLVVQTITSSVDFVTGSTRFGSLLANSHVFTGSMSVSGSITSQGGFILGNSATIAPTGSIGYNNAIGVFIYGKSGSEADFRLYNASGLTAMSVVAGTQNVSFNSSVAIGTTNLSARLNVQASANFENATLGTATGTMGYLSANGLYGMYVGIGNSGNTWLQSQRNDGTTAVYNLLLNPQGGNVGIGTSSPGAILDSQTNSGTGNILNSTDVIARFGNSNTNPGNHVSSGIQVFQGTGTLGSGYAAGFLAADNNTAIAQQQNTISLISPTSMTGGINLIAADASATIKFYTGGFTTERMRITSGGTSTVLLGKTSSIWQDTSRGTLEINGVNTALLGFTRTNDGTATAYLYYDSGNNFYIQNNKSGAAIYMQSGNSGGVQLTAGSTAFAPQSDERLKNIDSNILDAVSKLMTLRTIKYSWKNDSTNKINLGLIAQDVEKVFPEVIEKSIKKENPISGIDKDDTDYLSLKYTDLIPVLVKAIQELKAEFEEYKTTHP
jgi:hypothetical protein